MQRPDPKKNVFTKVPQQLQKHFTPEIYDVERLARIKDLAIANLLDENLKVLPDNLKRWYLIVIATYHAELSDENLMQVATNVLGMNCKDIFYTITCLGRTKLFDEMLSNNPGIERLIYVKKSLPEITQTLEQLRKYRGDKIEQDDVFKSRAGIILDQFMLLEQMDYQQSFVFIKMLTSWIGPDAARVKIDDTSFNAIANEILGYVWNRITYDASTMLRCAIEAGSVGLVEKIKNLFNRYEYDELLTNEREALTHVAIENGNLELLRTLKWQDDEMKLFLENNKERYFENALKKNHFQTLKFLRENVSINKLLRKHSYYHFTIAANNGNQEILEWLLKEDEANQKKEGDGEYEYQIRRYDACLTSAAASGHLHIMMWFAAKEPELHEKIYKSYFQNQLGSICTQAVMHGHFEILKWLLSKPYQRDSIQWGNLLDYSIRSGRIDILNWLEAHITTNVLLEKLNPQKRGLYDMYYYKHAAKHGQITSLEWLFSKYKPSEKEIESAVMSGIENGNLQAINWFYNNLEVKYSKDFVPTALETGNLDVVKFFKNKYLNQDNFIRFPERYFPTAIKSNNIELINWLLSFPEIFRHAEAHDREYGSQYIYPFVATKIASLRARREAVEIGNGIFNLDNPDEVMLCFFMIRNIIRRNERSLDDDLSFIINNIPGVSQVLHHNLEGMHGDNALLRFAIDERNQAAAAILLTVPRVRALAVRANYYRQEGNVQIDFAALANDRESSMRSLSKGEQKRLERANKAYQPAINERGVATLMKELRQLLINRYMKNPAKITVNDQEIQLPLTWEEFQKLKLTPEQREEALVAYYDNSDHTALRYISKPDRWMAADASYVNVEPASGERWSTFDQYEPLIVMLYLAAIDETRPPIDGHTLEGRIDHFIQELALLCRAHNWDTSRMNEKGKEEEYDDKKGDKPSCYSGVKRRLFQSVVGHELLLVLTEAMMKEELSWFIKDHFRSKFNEGIHRAAFETAIKCVRDYDDIPKDTFDTLRKLDIPQAAREKFITYLNKKYEDQSLEFVPYIINRFVLPADNEKPDKRKTHIMLFYTMANLDVVLQPPKVSGNEGLFARSETASVVEPNQNRKTT